MLVSQYNQTAWFKVYIMVKVNVLPVMIHMYIQVLIYLNVKTVIALMLVYLMQLDVHSMEKLINQASVQKEISR